MERERLVKVVRDRVPEYLPHSEVEYRPIDDHLVFITELRKKLAEEVAEYLLAPGLDELADVLSVVRSLAEFDLHVTERQLIGAMLAKSERMGPITKGLGMYVTTTEEQR